MLKLFKAKSLKKTQKAGAGAGVQAGNKSRKKEKSKGRSMVEMLGVLAIIGVLSIGGIQGYTIAMRKYRANEILNVANKYAMVLYAGCQQAMEQNPTKYGIMSDNNGYHYSSEKNFWCCPERIAFTNSGIGSLPNGVTQIETVYPPSYMADNDGVDVNHFIKSTEKGDVIFLKIAFDSVELCETMQGIIGEEYSTVNSWFPDDIKKSCRDQKMYFLHILEN